MRTLIYGAGAVGLGIGSALLKAGERVCFVGRQGTVAALKRDGLVRTGIFGEYRTGPETLEAVTRLADLPQPTDFDYVLVCTKASDTETAAIDIAAHPALADGASRIVLFQNGWGNAEVFAEHLPKERIYSARVITGFVRPEPNHVDITVTADATRVGTLFGEAEKGVGDLNGSVPDPLFGRSSLSEVEPLCAAITDGDLSCEVCDDVARHLWAKMLYNCALNPLGAIFGVPYGALAESGYTRTIMDTIHREAFAVMEACGYATQWPTPEAYAGAFYGRLVPPTAAHESSMLQDIRAGKRTEIDALNGAIVSLADAHGLTAPVNRTVRDMICFLETRHAPPPRS